MIGRRIPTIWTLLFAIAAAISLMVVPTASATTNLVPNPGFEDANCAPLPCDWTASASTSLARDTSTFASGSASLRIDVPPNETGSANVLCVPVVLTAGNHDVSFWYNNSDPNIQAAATRFEITFTSGPGCSTFLGADQVFGTGTGGWLKANGTVNVPAGTTGVFFTLYTSCFQSACSGRFDDIDFEAEVTAVTVSSFGATRSATGVRVGWRTGSEAELLGFQVYRSRGHSWKRLTRSLIVAKGSVSGASYRFLDKTASRGVAYSYRIKALNRDGTTSWFGPVRVT
jgi:hypothetical protein